MFTLSLLVFLILPPLRGQVYYEKKPEDADKVSICVWPQVPLFAEPGQSSELATYALFGEELRHLGEEALVRRERNNYVLVETRDGVRGWIDDQYIIRHAGLAVMLENARVFNKPSSYATSSGLRFYAGELVVLSDWEENWVYLTGEKGRIFGWVEGYDRLSVEAIDIEVAGMLRRALMIEDPNDQLIALRSILSRSEYSRSPVYRIVEDVVAQLTIPQSAPPVEGDVFGMPENGEPSASPSDDPAYQEVVMYDENNQPFVRVKEIGTVQAVEAKNPPSMYYAYHKSVPIGDKILLQIPGDQGYIELDVVSRLRESNPNVVGLGAEVIQKVLGASRAKEVDQVTILYVKPE
jgi:hypothetical protein